MRIRGRLLIDWVGYSAALIGVGLVLIAVGQPIFTDDVWWHLALGRAYADHGPWLAEDPLLFTSNGPPPPLSWLADVTLWKIWNTFGFAGLRVFHVSWIAATLAIVWSILEKASGNRMLASVGAALMALLSAYRLVQLRPDLATIALALLLFRVLLQDREVPSPRRCGVAILMMALWANLHPAYPIGPVLVLASCAGLYGVAYVQSENLRRLTRARAGRLLIVATLGVGATLLNPVGADAYRLAFSAGVGSEGLAVVLDEWNRFQPFSPPSASLPPSLLLWISTWILFVALSVAVFRRVRGTWKGEAHAQEVVVLVAAAAGFVAMLSASRFAWMAVFPLALLAGDLREHLRKARVAGALAVFAVALVPAFLAWGDWPMVTRGMPRTPEGYRIPYASSKYHGHAVSILRGAGLEGNLFARYPEGGFISFWLSPSIRPAIGGSLHATEDAMNAAFAIRERIGTPAHPRFEEAVDAMGIDLFLGTGLPVEQGPGQPPNYSTIHLEGVPGWIPIFRNLDSSIYLRRNDRNDANLDRIAAYYAAHGVPFDRARGFEPQRVLTRATAWAETRGVWTPFLVVPRGSAPTMRDLDRVASAYLALGIYAPSWRANEALLRIAPLDPGALRRRAWLLLRPSRNTQPAEIKTSVRALSELSDTSRLSGPGRTLLALLQRGFEDAATSRRYSQTVPVFTQPEAWALLGSAPPGWVEEAEVEPLRD